MIYIYRVPNRIPRKSKNRKRKCKKIEIYIDYYYLQNCIGGGISGIAPSNVSRLDSYILSSDALGFGIFSFSTREEEGTDVDTKEGAGEGLLLLVEPDASKDMGFESCGALFMFILGGLMFDIVVGKELVDIFVATKLLLGVDVCDIIACCCCCRVIIIIDCCCEVTLENGLFSTR